MILNLPWSPSQIEPGRIPLQSHDQDPGVDKPPFQAIKETYIVLFLSISQIYLIDFKLFMIIWWPDFSHWARKIFLWMTVIWLDNWQLTNDFHFEKSALAKFTYFGDLTDLLL